MSNEVFFYGDAQLTAAAALALARRDRRGALSAAGRTRVAASQQHLEALVASEVPVYGVNTGFGPMCRVRIERTQLGALQRKLLRSHAVGVGADLPRELVRLMLVLKIQALALGYSGVSVELLERLMWFVAEDLTPRIPSQGSLGASGDLAPLAHMALPLIGEGVLWHKGRYVPASEALAAHGLQALTGQPKEALALINGTQFIAAHGVMLLEGLHRCLEQADVLAALSLEAFLGSSVPYGVRLHELRPYAGAQLVAYRLRLLLADSEMMQSHADCNRVQDPYSFRCVPQVHGASRECWQHLKRLLCCELNAVTDNPLIFEDGSSASGGNFHGQPLALPLDYATVAAAELANVSERRIYQLSHGGYDHLPPLLISDAGLNSGFMMPHYTAAALVSENKTLSHPASVDSIPSSMGQEDHVSMGAWGGRKALAVLRNLEWVLAIEYLYAAQGFDFRRPRRSSPALEAAHELLRSRVAFRKDDDSQSWQTDLQASLSLLQANRLTEVVRTALETAGKSWLPEAYDHFEL